MAKEVATTDEVTLKVTHPIKPAINASQLAQIPVYVGITFDPCQGIREAQQKGKNNPIPSKVVFDCRPIELAPE